MFVVRSLSPDTGRVGPGPPCEECGCHGNSGGRRCRHARDWKRTV